MQLASGTLLHGGTYKIERTLGQGSFGITYLATHTSLERKVAIKEFFMKELNSRGNDGSITGMSDGSLSYNYGQKFKKEALNLSRLEHPNIVRVTDSFDENGTYYYVMDYIEGENLNDYLKHTAVSQKEAIDIITAVAKALQYMHDTKHMLHLDLKPGNIMRRASDGHIFLIDFGLSKHFSNSGQPETSTTIGLGTPGYAPIEQSNQAKNGEFRPTIDVYALGATLFKLLTRVTPPPASDIVSDDELIEDKLRANGITGNIIDVVVNAMLPNVRKRTQSVGAFIWALTSNNTPATSTAATSKANVQNEETIIAGAATSKGEETIVTPTTTKHLDFDESKYVIPAKFKNYPTATGSKANSGDVEAMLALGMMALRGENVLQDTDTAYAWFQKMKNIGDGRGEMLMNQWYKLKEKYKKKESVPVQTVHNEEESSNKTGCVLLFVIVVIVAIIVGTNSNGCNRNHYYYEVCDTDSAMAVDTVCCDTVEIDYAATEDFSSGYHEIYYGNGAYYKGNFKNGEYHGYGVRTWKKENGGYLYKYEGNWSHGVRSGQGIGYYSDDSWYDGQWKNDKWNGVGIWYKADYTYIKANWRNHNLESTIEEGTWSDN